MNKSLLYEGWVMLKRKNCPNFRNFQLRRSVSHLREVNTEIAINNVILRFTGTSLRNFQKNNHCRIFSLDSKLAITKNMLWYNTVLLIFLN